PFVSICLLIVTAVFLASPRPQVLAQSQSSGSQNTNQTNPNQQETPPEAGGPNDNVGPYAIPAKKEPPPAPPPERRQKIDNVPDYSIRVDVPLVDIPVMVTTKDGQFIPNLHQENFKVFEDGIPQTINHFGTSHAPITCVLLVEFASTNYYFVREAVNDAYMF